MYNFDDIFKSSDSTIEHYKRLKSDSDYKNKYQEYIDNKVRDYWSNREPFKGVNDIPSLPRNLDDFYIKNIIRCGGISKSELKDGATYIGRCRNNTEATWNKELNVFIYERCKFGIVYTDEINHFEDDDGFDLFVPIALK